MIQYLHHDEVMKLVVSGIGFLVAEGLIFFALPPDADLDMLLLLFFLLHLQRAIAAVGQAT